jgi:hypothetical protein
VSIVYVRYTVSSEMNERFMILFKQINLCFTLQCIIQSSSLIGPAKVTSYRVLLKVDGTPSSYKIVRIAVSILSSVFKDKYTKKMIDLLHFIYRSKKENKIDQDCSYRFKMCSEAQPTIRSKSDRMPSEITKPPKTDPSKLCSI